jgi:hypothetical protein
MPAATVAATKLFLIFDPKFIGASLIAAWKISTALQRCGLLALPLLFIEC